jgi:6-phosphogluconolactonase (cycloisomerase 2 family)
MKKLLCVLAMLYTISLHAIGCFSTVNSSEPEAVSITNNEVTSSEDSETPAGLASTIDDGVALTGEGPNFVAYSHSGKFAAVTNGIENTISMYKVKKTGAFKEISSSSFGAGKGPDCIAFSPSDRHVAVTTGNRFFSEAGMENSSIRIYRMDVKTGNLKEIQTIQRIDDLSIRIPTSITYSPDGRFVAVANYAAFVGQDSVSIYGVSPITGKLYLPAVQTFTPTGSASGPYVVAYSPDGRFAAVTLHKNGMVATYQVDLATGKFGSEAILGTGLAATAGVVYSHNGLFAAVVNSDSVNPANAKSVTTYSVDQTSGKFTTLQASVAAGAFPNYVAYSHDDKVAAVANYVDGTVTFYCVDDVGNFSFKETLNINGTLGNPLGIAFAPSSNFVAVTDFTRNNVSVFLVDETACP